MLEIKRKQSNTDSGKSAIQGDECELSVNGTYVGDAKVSGSSPKLEIDIENFEVSKKIVNHSFFQIFKSIHSLILEYPQDWVELYPKIFVHRDDDKKRFTIILTLYLDRNNWKQLWSVKEYIQEFDLFVQSSNPSNICLRRCDDEEHNLVIELEFKTSLGKTLIGSEIKQAYEILRELHNKIVRNLVSKLRGDSVVMYFDFPEEVKTPCEQYLLYFVRFLRDLGIESTAELKEDAGQVLFSVTPTNKRDALDKIYDALRIYLCLPSSHLISPSVEYDIAIQRLSANIDNLNAQLRLAYAEVQYKNATIQAQQFLIENQRRELNSKNIFESSRITTTQERNEEKEELIRGFSITKYKNNWLEIDLPDLIRQLKRFFSGTK
ncbi:MAG: hypothetical protein MUD14_02210 [Hydrococcus sp. Prado102]|jgi:hypothetical protein|nr:hypothetical protein [Hydrococcus sp. Prado102]